MTTEAPKKPSTDGLTQLQANYTAPTPQAHPDVYLAITWNAAELPSHTDAISDEQKTGLTHLRSNLDLWSQNGLVPVTYEQLHSGCGCPSDSVTGIKAIVGEKIWEKFYPAKRVVTQTNYVPMQLSNILRSSIGRIADQYTADVKKEEIARLHFEGIIQQDVIDRKSILAGTCTSAGAYGYCAY